MLVISSKNMPCYCTCFFNNVDVPSQNLPKKDTWDRLSPQKKIVDDVFRKDCWMFRDFYCPIYFTGLRPPSAPLNCSLLSVGTWDGAEGLMKHDTGTGNHALNVWMYDTTYTFRMAILASLANGTSLKYKSRFSQELMFFWKFLREQLNISKTHWGTNSKIRCRGGRCRLSSRSPSIPRLFINLRGIPAFDGASPVTWLPPWPLLYKPHEVPNSTWNKNNSNNNNNNTIQQWVKDFKGAVIHDTLGSSHQLRSLNRKTPRVNPHALWGGRCLLDRLEGKRRLDSTSTSEESW